MPNSNATDLSPETLDDLDDLAQIMTKAVDLFSNLNRQSVMSMPKKYEEKFQIICNDLIGSGQIYKEGLQLASAEAEAGGTVSNDIVYLLDQLMEKNTPRSEITDLLEDLEVEIRRLVDASTKVKEKFTSSHERLLSAQARLYPLREEITSDRGAAVIGRQKAEEGVRETIAGSAIVNGITYLGSFFIPSLPVDVVSARAMMCTKDVEAAKKYKREQVILEGAITSLNTFEPVLLQGIRLIGNHIRYWTHLHGVIKAAKLDPDRLFKDSGLPKVAIVKKHRKGWNDIREKYRFYGETANMSKQILMVQSP